MILRGDNVDECVVCWSCNGGGASLVTVDGAIMQLTPQASKTHLPEEAGRLSKRAASDVSSDTYTLSIDTSSYFSVAKIP
jgi:hypothetical protein